MNDSTPSNSKPILPILGSGTVLGSETSDPNASPQDGSARMGGCGSMGGTIPGSGKLFEPSRRLPSWLRREVPKGNGNQFT
jgi:hypothetical protein